MIYFIALRDFFNNEKVLQDFVFDRVSISCHKFGDKFWDKICKVFPLSLSWQHPKRTFRRKRCRSRRILSAPSFACPGLDTNTSIQHCSSIQSWHVGNHPFKISVFNGSWGGQAASAFQTSAPSYLVRPSSYGSISLPALRAVPCAGFPLLFLFTR